MLKKLFLFDLDGTLCIPSYNIDDLMIDNLKLLKSKNNEIGIVGGGGFSKILLQINNRIIFDHIFCECGSVYYKYNYVTEIYELIYTNNLTEHREWSNINILIKKSLDFLSKVDYLLSGNFIDRRNGLVYVSLIGNSATKIERDTFMELDRVYKYREKLMNILKNTNDNIEIVYGGSVGIAIYPKEWNKVQIVDKIEKNNYDKIYYFGDKYLENGNDYLLINNKHVCGIKVDKPEDTIKCINELL